MEWPNPEPKIFSVLCVGVSVTKIQPCLNIFFVRTNFSSWSIFSFPNPIYGSVSPEQISWHTFLERLPSHRKVRPKVHFMMIHEGNHVLSVQSFPVRSVRVHWTDYCRNRSNTTDFSSPENGFSQWITITQGYLHYFFYGMDDGWIHSWETTCFSWLFRMIPGSISLDIARLWCREQ